MRKLAALDIAVKRTARASKLHRRRTFDRTTLLTRWIVHETMKIALGADHAGFEYKDRIAQTAARSRPRRARFRNARRDAGRLSAIRLRRRRGGRERTSRARHRRLRLEPRHRDGGEQSARRALRAGRRTVLGRACAPPQRCQRHRVFRAADRMGDGRADARRLPGYAVRRRPPRPSHRAALRVRRRAARAHAQGSGARRSHRRADAQRSHRKP